MASSARCQSSALSPEIDEIQAAAAVVSSLLTEKLPLPHGSAILLSSIVRPTFPSFEQTLRSCCPSDIRATKRVKVDAPLLTNDPELDVARFRLSSLEKLKINLPLETLSVENDESLIFPSNFWTAADDIRRNAVQTRLDATQEIVQLLQDVRRLGCHTRIDLDIWEVSHQTATLDLSVHRKSRKLALRAVTPPLLSRPLTPEEYLPGSPSLQVPLVPQPETPPIPQHDQIKHLLAADGTVLPPENKGTGDVAQEDPIRDLLLRDAFSGITSCDPNETTQSIGLPPAMTRLERKRRSSALKIETPLTPPLTVKKRKHSNDASVQVQDIIAGIKNDAILTAEAERSTQNGEILEGDLASLAQTALEQVRERLRKETLRNVAPDLKLSLPHVMATETVPPWNFALSATNKVQESVSAMLREVASIRLQSTTDIESHLNWTWLELSKMCKLEEGVTGDTWLEWLIDAPEDGLLSYESLLYEAEGLGLLARATEAYTEQDLFDTDTINGQHKSMMQTNEQSRNVDTALQQTKECSFSSTIADQRESSVLLGRKTTQIHNSSSRKKTNHKPRCKAVTAKIPSLQFSARASLADFMALRGKGNESTKVPVSRKGLNENNKAATSPSHLDLPVWHETPALRENKNVPLPMPQIPNISAPRQSLTLILSANLLKTHRPIVRELELLPQPCHLIFRDYEDDRLQLPNHLADRDPNIQEADIILSPRTGIIFSSIQETMQKYLPGQARKRGDASSSTSMMLDSPLQAKIASAASRYEELYVLLCCMPTKAALEFLTSSSSLTTVTPSKGGLFIDEHSARAVTSFSSFCAALAPSAVVKPVIVSPPSAKVVTGWVVALANDAHCEMPWSMDQNLPLANTSREMFLRRAGLNTFAALFVLRWKPGRDYSVNQRQKGADGWTGGTDCGPSCEEVDKMEADLLAGFVQMSPVDRQRKYDLILGSKSLRRVEKAIEMEW